MSDLRLILTTCPDRDTALRIARALVEEKYAACVSLISGVQSIYQWQGEIEEDDEFQLLCKTPAANCSALLARIEELHPYAVPELIVLDPAHVSPAYAAWASHP